MTQGISNSLNVTLTRLDAIENNFDMLDNIDLNTIEPVDTQVIEANNKKDFKTILEEKMAKVKKDDALTIKGSILSTNDDENIPQITEPIEKQAVNLLAKIELHTNNNNSSSRINKSSSAPTIRKEDVRLLPKIEVNPQRVAINKIIDMCSDKYGVDKNLIKAIVKQESGFNVNATSKKGAMGLMQLMPATAKSLGIVDAYNPAQNIEGGVRYVKGLLDRFDNNKKLALAAYNAGTGAVKKYGGVPPYKETQNYVNSILGTYNKFKKEQL